jgi:hypothetical protein
MGYDTFEGEHYPLDGEGHDGKTYLPEYPAYEAALEDAQFRLAYLEQTQPAASSGGQGFDGIQDRVYIIHPDGRPWERVLPEERS